MAESEKKKMSAKDRQIAKINQLKARLQNEENKLRSQARKERNAQLIAFGVFFEKYLKDKPGRIPSMKQAMQRLLDSRNLDRALAGVLKIEEWLKKNEKTLEDKNLDNNFFGSPEKEISPEPPSQLPDAEATEKNQGSA